MGHSFTPDERVVLTFRGNTQGKIVRGLYPDTSRTRWYEVQMDDGSTAYAPGRQIELAPEAEIRDTFVVEVTLGYDHYTEPTKAINDVLKRLDDLPEGVRLTAYSGWRIFEAPKES